jgi:hypothetical protein
MAGVSPKGPRPGIHRLAINNYGRLRQPEGDGTDRAGAKGMKFDIYGRYRLEVIREAEAWLVYRVDNDKRRRVFDVVIPSSTRKEEIPTYLDDLLHELASPGATIRCID